jgi:putative heme-binding domain-containing protein
LELNRLLTPFERSTDEDLGLQLLDSLEKSSSLPSLRMDLVRQTLAKYGPPVQAGVERLQLLVSADAAPQRQRIEELLPSMSKGDARRGHAIFHSSRAACTACHRLGYAGGTIGPDLSRIGEIRTERDLLEAILFPSLSLARSYEPVLIVTVEGRSFNGTIRHETDKEYVLAIGADQEVRVRREDIEQIQPSTISIMPTGLDKQLTVEELADLVTFLKNAAGK